MYIASNGQVEEWGQLKTRVNRKASGLFMVEGEKGVREAIDSGFVQVILATESFIKANTWIQSLSPIALSERQMSKLSVVVTPPEIMAVVRQKKVGLEDIAAHDLIACFDGISDPGNLGTMLRTADWFGVKAILLDESGVDLYNDKVVRSTMGSLFHLDCLPSADLIADLGYLKKQEKFSIIATDVHGTTTVVPDGKRCLVMGSESHGVRPEILRMAHSRYTIPGPGGAESLNVAVSFGIMLSHL
jgi:TrmH family RNA methyltransferase